jgi:tetratricopeptide (TPR) repeat protein
MLFSASVALSQKVNEAELLKIINYDTGIVKADALNQLAYLQRKTDSLFYSTAKKALDYSKKIHYGKGVFEAFRNYQYFHQQYGNYHTDSIFVYSAKAIKYLKKHQETDLLAQEYSYMGRTHLLINQFDSARYYQEIALKLFDITGNQKDKAIALDRIGLTYTLENVFLKALEYYDSALKIYRKISYPNGVAVTNYHIGYTHLYLANYKTAADYIYKALEYFIAVNNKANIWNAYEMLGNIYLKIKDYPMALEMHQKALDIRIESHKDRPLADSLNLAYAYSYNNIGEVYLYQGKIDSALKLFNASLNIKLHKGSKASAEDIGNSYLLKGKAFRKLTDHHVATQHILRARSYYREAHFKTGIANTFLEEGQLLYQQNQNKDALLKLDTALSLACETGEKNIRMNVHELAALIHMASGNKESASEHYSKYHALNETVFDKGRLFTLAELHLLKEKEQLEKDWKKEVNLRKKQLSFHRSIRFFWVAVIVLFLLTILYIFKNKEKREIAYNRLQRQVRKDSLLERMGNEHDLHIIREQFKGIADENKLAEIERALKVSSKNTFDQDFLFIYRNIDDDFLKKLHKKHPDLTQHDQVLCSMIRMGLNSKQIAHITFRSPGSIHVARSRLRKKMGLPHTKDLACYLQNIG